MYKSNRIKHDIIINCTIINFASITDVILTGDVNTCFHALLLVSICVTRLVIRIINIGSKNAAPDWNPFIKCSIHGFGEIDAIK